MTVSNDFLLRSSSGCVCLALAVIALLSFSTIAQSPARGQLQASIEVRSISLGLDEEDSRSDGVIPSLNGTSSPQTETRPKPHPAITISPVLTASLAIEESESAIKDDPARPQPRIRPTERFQIPRAEDPYWRPLPPPGRFSGDDRDKSSSEDDESASSQNGHSNKFHWRPAILQSLMIQGVQHVYAVTIQEKTRRELKGPWFKDWFQSVKNIHGWDDGNRFFTNYIAHPMQGGMTGFIFLQNHDRLKRQKFAESKTYWVDRLKAMAWSAAWSTQWEIGPISQASIGNVGLKKGMAFVDLTITPTVGTGWMITEEALDRYIIRHLEKHTNFVMKIFLRTLLNPMRGVANTLRLKPPWYRDRPFGT